MKPLIARLRDESGFSLIELAVAAAISLIIFSAALTAFSVMQRQRVNADRLLDSEQQARQGVDRLARQLRNLASPGASISAVSSTKPNSIDRNLPYDLVFKDIDQGGTVLATNPANVRRVRYCLQTSGAIATSGRTASSSHGALIVQLQRTSASMGALPASPPADTACPAAGWDSSQLVADYVTNAAAAQPVFRYSSADGEITGTDAVSRPHITRIEASLLIDPDPLQAPTAARLTTSVVLRNQNRAPIPAFTATPIGINCTVQLNGSASEDPENKRLKYAWYDNGVPIAGTDDLVVVQKQFTKPGTHVFTLKVTDPASLSETSAPQTITC